MKVRLVVALSILWFTCACGPMQPSEQHATDYVSKLRFSRHANGLCFGVVEYQTYGAYTGVSITVAPQMACGGGPEPDGKR